MNQYPKIVNVLILLTFSLPSISQIELLPRAISSLEISKSDVYNRLCHVKKFEFGSVVFLSELIIQEDDYLKLKGHILLYGTNQKLTAKHTLKEPLYIDAVNIATVRVAKSPFFLPGKTIFGIYFTYEGPSRVDPFQEIFLDVFEIREDNIKPIVNQLNIKSMIGTSDGSFNWRYTNKRTTLFTVKQSLNEYQEIVAIDSLLTYRIKQGVEKLISIETKSDTLYYRSGKYKSLFP